MFHLRRLGTKHNYRQAKYFSLLSNSFPNLTEIRQRPILINKNQRFHGGRISNKTLNFTIQTNNNSIIETNKKGVVLRYGDYKIDVPYVWLRDHCRCQTCYNNETFQKTNELPLFPLQVPKSIEFDNPVLTITWQDNHLTSYNIEWLLQNTYHDRHMTRIERVLWNKDIIQKQHLPVVEYKEYMNTDEGLQKHLTNLLKFGFAIISGVQPNHVGTLEVSKRVCFIMETFYGASYQFTTNMEFKDTAYTNSALGAHTDNTYFSAPSGIQVFHVIKHDGDGGQTLLVDGFNAGETLRKTSPDSFEVLTELVVPHEYIDNDRHLRSHGTVLSTHPTTKELNQIRYNPYDRAPLYTLKSEEAIRFYESYDKLSKIITNPDNEFWIKLQPDMVLFVDNWRAMHGRSAFTGSRHVSGCYLPHDDWKSIARSIGLLNISL